MSLDLRSGGCYEGSKRTNDRARGKGREREMREVREVRRESRVESEFLSERKRTQLASVSNANATSTKLNLETDLEQKARQTRFYLAPSIFDASSLLPPFRSPPAPRLAILSEPLNPSHLKVCLSLICSRSTQTPYISIRRTERTRHRELGCFHQVREERR